MQELSDSGGIDQANVWAEHATELVRFAALLVGPTDAQDVVAVAFMKLWKRRPAEIDNARAYLFRIVTTTAWDQLRSQRRRQARDLHAVQASSTTDASIDVDVRRAIVKLPVRQRAVVYFAYWEDLDPAQIASLLGVATKTVRRQLKSAQASLRKDLE
jgi:RNA polymerase sigma factor (sigma-70 family)